MDNQGTFLVVAFARTRQGREMIQYLRNRSVRCGVRQRRRNKWEYAPDKFGAHRFADTEGQVEKILTFLRRLRVTTDAAQRGYAPVILRMTKPLSGVNFLSNFAAEKIWPVSALEALALCAE